MKVECVGEDSRNAWLHTVSSTEHVCTCTTHGHAHTHTTTAAHAQKIAVMSRATLRTVNLTSGHSIGLSLSLSHSVSLSLSHSSSGGVDFSILFAHTEIIIFGIFADTESRAGFYWDCGCGDFDLPSFDVVQEGHFNVHQKGEKCHLEVMGVFKESMFSCNASIRII